MFCEKRRQILIFFKYLLCFTKGCQTAIFVMTIIVLFNSTKPFLKKKTLQMKSFLMIIDTCTSLHQVIFVYSNLINLAVEDGWVFHSVLFSEGNKTLILFLNVYSRGLPMAIKHCYL